MDKTQLDDFIQRYIAMWHETDPQLRSEKVLALWAEDAENVTRRFVIRGLAEIIPRVDRAHRDWVAEKGFLFRPSGNSDSHNNLVKFFWEMVPKGGGPVDSRGLDIFVLNDQGKIQSLYQFSEPVNAT